MFYVRTLLFCILSAATLAAGETVLTVEPQTLSGIPGEPLRVELTVETGHAAPVQVRIPSVSNLVLRTVEKIPIQRTKTGAYVQKRIIIWQGTEAGTVTLTNMTAVFQGLEETFPNLGITINPVEPAQPPAKGEPK